MDGRECRERQGIKVRRGIKEGIAGGSEDERVDW